MVLFAAISRRETKKDVLRFTSAQFLMRNVLLVYSLNEEQIWRQETTKKALLSIWRQPSVMWKWLVCFLITERVSSPEILKAALPSTGAAFGKTEIVRVLIDAGSDCNAVDGSGNTPLHVSAGSGHIEVVRLLIEKGAEMFAVNNEGFTPSGCAKLFGHMEVEQFIEERHFSE